MGLSLEECCLYLKTHISHTAKNKRAPRTVPAGFLTTSWWNLRQLFWFFPLLLSALNLPACCSSSDFFNVHFCCFSPFLVTLISPSFSCPFWLNVTPICASAVYFVTGRQFRFFLVFSSSHRPSSTRMVKSYCGKSVCFF